MRTELMYRKFAVDLLWRVCLIPMTVRLKSVSGGRWVRVPVPVLAIVCSRYSPDVLSQIIFTGPENVC